MIKKEIQEKANKIVVLEFMNKNILKEMIKLINIPRKINQKIFIKIISIKKMRKYREINLEIINILKNCSTKKN